MTSVCVSVVFEVDVDCCVGHCVLDGMADVVVNVEDVCVDEEGCVSFDENVVGVDEGCVVVSI